MLDLIFLMILYLNKILTKIIIYTMLGFKLHKFKVNIIYKYII